jgi:sec-independent protein translocase protein TatA
MFNSVFLLFDIGGGEIILIMGVALLLFGGEKLPELARGLGKGIRDFKDASEGVKREIANQIDNFETKKAEEQAATTEAALPEHKDEAIISPDHLVEGHVANTIPAGESHVATDNTEFIDQVINEKRNEHHAEDAHGSAEPVKDQYKS